MEGLEPTHLTALDPKSSMSTNFITSALHQLPVLFPSIVGAFAQITFAKVGAKISIYFDSKIPYCKFWWPFFVNK